MNVSVREHLPNFVLKSHDYSYGTYENDRKPALIPHKNCLLNHHLVHAHSEQ